MALRYLYYNSGGGLGQFSSGDQIIWALGDSSGSLTVLSVGYGFPVAGFFVVDTDANGDVPNGSDLSRFPQFNWVGVSTSMTPITARNVILRNPGAKFNVSLSSGVSTSKVVKIKDTTGYLTASAVKVWNGTTWVTAAVKVWNGTTWTT